MSKEKTSIEENKKRARMFIERAINQQDLDGIDEIMAPEWTKHNHLKNEIFTHAVY